MRREDFSDLLAFPDNRLNIRDELLAPNHDVPSNSRNLETLSTNVVEICRASRWKVIFSLSLPRSVEPDSTRCRSGSDPFSAS
jgi:hypothetical protein